MGQEYEENGFQPINENPLTLDFMDCKYIVDLHLLLKHKFGLPKFYGQNWDALWDMLDDLCYLHEPLTVEIINYHCMPKDMKEYCEEGLFEVFNDIHDKYPQITFEMIS